MLASQYDTGNGVEESVRFLLLSLYDLEFGVEESTGPGLLHVQYGWIDGVEESRTQQHYITLLHFDTVLWSCDAERSTDWAARHVHIVRRAGHKILAWSRSTG